MSNIDTVWDFIDLFSGASSFNQDLNNWDTSNINLMNGMFRNATNFNQDLSDWDTSNVTNMGAMFSGATSLTKILAIGTCLMYNR